ncbi:MULTISPECIES: hypothetical protein [unclassified Streptomyces]|uniref:hypothetical protein n=1 Tax=unclassified Streptomyces TaxID=2593676 RepID=UPI00382ED151
MTARIATNATWKGRLARGGAVVGLGAAVLAGLATAPAQAAEPWRVNGPIRYNQDQASADIPRVEAECRRQDGYPSGRSVLGAWSTVDKQWVYYAQVSCMPKRDV